MKNKIKVDYEAVQRLIKYFGTTVDTIGADISDLEKLIEGDIRSTWKGVAATQFFTDWERIRENLQKLDTALEIGGQNLQQIAQIFRAAEEKAKGHFHK